MVTKTYGTPSCAGACVYDDVGVGRMAMAGDLLQIIKTAWINASAFVRSIYEIDFGGGRVLQRRRKCYCLDR
jgi:hypothetical protein